MESKRGYLDEKHRYGLYDKKFIVVRYQKYVTNFCIEYERENLVLAGRVI
ncbi:protein of unknown function [Bartonella clarridgeiae 73]|uniref:Uncharacterized protein n=1 Tax=Bartonella clarridgeiae (strain CCUG 45776 / CIP 104772 / 73) TaxID=696125 RepID=E6YIV8_BARC7|nr:protein of unknown function [Bartonella clarridgeiae 73]